MREIVIKRILRFFNKHTLVIVFLIVLAFFSLTTSDFLSLSNLSTILFQYASTLIAVIGLSFIIIGGGIDFSVGYQISLVSVIIGILSYNHLHPLLILFISIFLGLLCGMINGLLVTILKIAPFYVTLSTQVILKGISYAIAGGRVYSDLPDSLLFVSRGKLFNISIFVWIALACLLILPIVFKYTYLGKHIIAVGENETAATKSGINTSKIKTFCYMMGSFFFVIAAIIMTSRSGMATPSNGVGLEITGITAVFLSEVYLFPSSNVHRKINSWRLIISTMLIGIIENGMYNIGWNRYIRYIALGIILILTLTIYQYNHTSYRNKKIN
jgi:ribose/xylose/arabinose/galactoside ABC-type transport system permease subunit